MLLTQLFDVKEIERLNRLPSELAKRRCVENRLRELAKAYTEIADRLDKSGCPTCHCSVLAVDWLLAKEQGPEAIAPGPFSSLRSPGRVESAVEPRNHPV